MPGEHGSVMFTLQIGTVLFRTEPCYTVNAEIFVGEIFRGLNFHGVKFSWLKPPTKIGRHENFATLTVCSMERCC